MFDTIGRFIDPEAGRRRSASVLLASLMLGGAIGGATWVAMRGVAPPVVTPDRDFEVQLMEDDVPGRPLEAPDVPARRGGGGSEGPEDAPPPEPEVSDPVPTVLDTLPPDTRTMASTPTGGPPGPTIGDGPGGPGIPGGSCLGGDCGTSPGEILEFHHTELRTRRAPTPSYPFGQLEDEPVRCIARVWIDERGRPHRVEVTECPPEFEAATKRGLLRWRWYPARDSSGSVVQARTKIGVTFRVPR